MHRGVSRADIVDGLRMTIFERNLVILYVVDRDQVHITNIFAGSRDYESLLKRDR